VFDSPKIAVDIGCKSEPIATMVFPEQRGAPIHEIKPRSEGVLGAIATTTP